MFATRISNVFRKKNGRNNWRALTDAAMYFICNWNESNLQFLRHILSTKKRNNGNESTTTFVEWVTAFHPSYIGQKRFLKAIFALDVTVLRSPAEPCLYWITGQFYINCMAGRTISFRNLICFQFGRRTHGQIKVWWKVTHARLAFNSSKVRRVSLSV